jgi:hypothetical protein
MEATRPHAAHSDEVTRRLKLPLRTWRDERRMVTVDAVAKRTLKEGLEDSR